MLFNMFKGLSWKRFEIITDLIMLLSISYHLSLQMAVRVPPSKKSNEIPVYLTTTTTTKFRM